jgi:hypothetical protein
VAPGGWLSETSGRLQKTTRRQRSAPECATRACSNGTGAINQNHVPHVNAGQNP